MNDSEGEPVEETTDRWRRSLLDLRFDSNVIIQNLDNMIPVFWFVIELLIELAKTNQFFLFITRL